ncbi:acetaldehyde dehydrogenase (acetylating) [Maledivibacter halophilus]|uniref:Acetaldehyde dehydrogenase n=1 Tax=Maledivibacter halophilus TaxID=36842 RepID=A0A1T5MKP6_9FIRM|nr:acetaldehyde dehydrogenase (acetylating) [Maledivibacter halophilus]SKC88564.1 acetaldehyde dehydrogenase [Maledivibacter halophilus]
MKNLDFDLNSIQEARDKARRGLEAAKKMEKLTDRQIDKIIVNMVKLAEENAVLLGEMATEETGFGVPTDKAYKNHMASRLLYEQIKDQKVSGIINTDAEKKIISVAHPVGLILGLVPSTNPTATVIYKSIISLKAGNAIIFSPHPSAVKCTTKAVEIMAQAAEEAGAPKGVIDCIYQVTLAATNELMHCDEVSLIIATGGPGMVKAAYSSGKPAIGVGAGNSPAYIEKTADVKKAVSDIIASKIFDYGTICASEQSIVCERSNHDAVVAELKAQGGYFMSEEETDAVCKVLFRGKNYTMNADCVGRSALVIAEKAGIEVPKDTKVLIGKQDGVGKGYPLSYEKLTSVLGFYTVEDWQEACDLCYDLLDHGLGHTLSIHTENPKIVLKFSVKPASRIVVNSGGSTGGSGLTTGLGIAFTLGCGTCGGSSVSENVGPEHLINIKKIAFGTKETVNTVENDDLWNQLKINVSSKTSTDSKDSLEGNLFSDEILMRAIRRAIGDLRV